MGRCGGQLRAFSERGLPSSREDLDGLVVGGDKTRFTFDGQRVEVQLASKVLNTMTRLGMPDSYRVA